MRSSSWAPTSWPSSTPWVEWGSRITYFWARRRMPGHHHYRLILNRSSGRHTSCTRPPGPRNLAEEAPPSNSIASVTNSTPLRASSSRAAPTSSTSKPRIGEVKGLAPVYEKPTMRTIDLLLFCAVPDCSCRHPRTTTTGPRDFLIPPLGELRRTHLPRTRLHKGRAKRAVEYTAG